MKNKFKTVVFLITLVVALHSSEAFDKTLPASFNLTGLNGTNGFIINDREAENTESWSGIFVRGVGDVNGDGIQDIIIYSHLNTFVVFGKKQKWPKAIDVASLDGTNGFRIIHEVKEHIEKLLAIPYLGFRVSGAGDLNGDGIDDILVSDTARGALIFGSKKPWPAVLKFSMLNGTNGFVISEGMTVSKAGDVNGDGFDDIMVANYIEENGEGKTWVIFGNKQNWPAFLRTADLNGKNGFLINGVNKDDQSGYSLSDIGDINGDGIDDILIGTRVGKCYAVFGSKEEWPEEFELYNLDGTNGFLMQDEKSFFNTCSGHAGGDINGDGLDDLLIGLLDPAKAYVIFGHKQKWPADIELKALNGTHGFGIEGATSNSGLISGLSVSSAGDFNADNITDILIGDAQAIGGGRSYVIFGHREKWPKLFNASSLNGSNGFTVYWIRKDDYMGHSVSEAGDFNGDGRDDILIGAPRAKNNAGQAYIIFGE